MIKEYLKTLIITKLGTSDDDSSAAIANMVDMSASNGKVLTVSSAEVEGDTVYTLSATWQEIYDAALAGAGVYLSTPTAVAALGTYDNGIVAVMGIAGDTDNGWGVWFSNEATFITDAKNKKPTYTVSSGS